MDILHAKLKEQQEQEYKTRVRLREFPAGDYVGLTRSERMIRDEPRNTWRG